MIRKIAGPNTKLTGTVSKNAKRGLQHLTDSLENRSAVDKKGIKPEDLERAKNLAAKYKNHINR